MARGYSDCALFDPENKYLNHFIIGQLLRVKLKWFIHSLPVYSLYVYVIQNRFLQPGKDRNFGARGLPLSKHIFRQIGSRQNIQKGQRILDTIVTNRILYANSMAATRFLHGKVPVPVYRLFTGFSRFRNFCHKLIIMAENTKKKKGDGKKHMGSNSKFPEKWYKFLLLFKSM